MKRIHINLQVAKLEDSLRFYTTLFGTDPTVRKPDYAKWMLEDPRVNFSLAERGASADSEDEAAGVQLGIEHLGIQAETPEELAVLRQRLDGIVGDVDHEGETTCCYHHSDKTWVTDAHGVGWEIFYTSGEATTYHGETAESRDDGCCASTCCGGNEADADVDAKADAAAA